MPVKIHSYPTRRGPTGRYEVYIKGKWVSRQYALILRRQNEGLCMCGQPLYLETKRCKKCLLVKRLYNREHQGNQPRSVSGRGRPTAEEKLYE